MAAPMRARLVSQASRTTPQLRTPTLTSQRFASHSSHGPHAGPKTEGFGASFYYTLLLIPSGYLMYTLSTSAERSPTGGLIGNFQRAYGDLRQKWTDRNTLHVRMVEQAGNDKNLFVNARMPNYVELKSPEAVFSTGSPYNVPAGHSNNMEKLIAHYQTQYRQDEEEKLARLRQKEQQTGRKPGEHDRSSMAEGRTMYGTVISARPQTGDSSEKSVFVE